MQVLIVICLLTWECDMRERQHPHPHSLPVEKAPGSLQPVQYRKHSDKRALSARDDKPPPPHLNGNDWAALSGRV